MIQQLKPWLVGGDSLVCFGDSITETAEGYSSLLKAALAGKGMGVVVSGRSGDKTTSALTRLVPDVIDHRPSAVFLFFGANDARVGRGKWADEPTVSPEAYKVNLVWMVHLCRQAGIKKFSIAPPTWRLEGDEWHENGDIYQPYCLAARCAADETGSLFVPVDSVFAEEWQKQPGHTGLLMTTDGIHPTKAGHALIARTVLSSWGL